MNSLFQSIVLVGMFAAITGCTTMQPDQHPVTGVHEQELNEIHRQLITLAEGFGVNSEQANRETTLGLISEIRMASQNYKIYTGSKLSEEDKDTVSSYLNYKPDILNTILEQDRFVRSLDKKRIIILPDKD